MVSCLGSVDFFVFARLIFASILHGPSVRSRRWTDGVRSIGGRLSIIFFSYFSYFNQKSAIEKNRLIRVLSLAVLDSEDDGQQEDDGQEHQDAGKHPALWNAGQRFDCTYVTIAFVVILAAEGEGALGRCSSWR